MAVARQSLFFLRHGATALNAAGLRCGGDVDLPLADAGHRQAALVARELVQRRIELAVIVVSTLQRTRQTADIIARHQPQRVEIVIEPAFDERYLGAWNRLPIEATQADLAAGITPPGGESSADFARRVRDGARRTLLPLLQRDRAERVLLVGSKGVARVLGELCGAAARSPLGNAELVEFDLSTFERPAPMRTAECTA
jgi:2,3-bisphosphoglycerate-dependent phosphoglycerate mutase